MQALKKGSYKTVGGEHYGTPKELWGFRSPKGKGKPERIAQAFLEANAALLGLDLESGSLEHQKTIRSLGADHVIFQQRLFKRRVHRAYVTVHVGRDGRVYLLKNRAMPPEKLPAKADFRIGRDDAVKRGRKALSGRRRAMLQDTEAMWYPQDDQLVPAWRVRLRRSGPEEEWIVYVNARTGGVISQHDNIVRATRALIFDPSPVTAIGEHERLLSDSGRQRRPPADAYRTVTLYGLGNTRYLDGRRVTTRATRRSRRIRRPADGDLRLRSHERGFEEVMVYHHIDSAIRYIERLGFRGSRAIFRAPLAVNVNGTRQDNSWYSPWDNTLTFGTGAVDDAEDGETIIHEFGHALQNAICLRSVRGGGRHGRGLRRLSRCESLRRAQAGAVPHVGDDVGRAPARARVRARAAVSASRRPRLDVRGLHRRRRRARERRDLVRHALGRPQEARRAGGGPAHHREPLPARRVHDLRSRRAGDHRRRREPERRRERACPASHLPPPQGGADLRKGPRD
jgi:hypothetical protein